MSTQRLNVTLPEDVSEILKTKKNKSEFLAEAVREKAINDKKKEIIEQARRLKKYYESDDDLTSLNSLDSQDFVD
ncbi:MAG: hypothetical protein M1393_03885 [Candidatus Thermoplasmatota archaeon]|nr:hypothetical protein [Candidatus Thermoplasmatota archaeon]